MMSQVYRYHFKWATFYANGLTYTWDSNGVGGENWQANDHPKEDKFTEALKRGPANKFVPYRVGDRLWVRLRLRRRLRLICIIPNYRPRAIVGN